MKDPHLLACCGTYCPCCAAAHREIGDQAEKLLTVVQRQGFLEMASSTHPEEAEKIRSFYEILHRIADSPACPGCHENGGEASCPIRDCCRGHGHQTCSECEKLERCASPSQPVCRDLREDLLQDRTRTRGNPAPSRARSDFFKRVTQKYAGWNLRNLLRVREKGHAQVIQEILSQEGFRTWQVKRAPDQAKEIYADFVNQTLLSSRWDLPVSSSEEKLLSRIPPHSKILSVGTGCGREIPFLLAKGCKVMCLDPSPVAVDILRKRFAQDVLIVQGRLGRDPCSCLKTSFDAIISLGDVFGGLFSQEDRQGFVTQALSLLNPRGLFIFDAILDDPSGLHFFEYPLPDRPPVQGCAYYPSQKELFDLLSEVGAHFKSVPLDPPRIAFIIRHGQMASHEPGCGT